MPMSKKDLESFSSFRKSLRDDGYEKAYTNPMKAEEERMRQAPKSMYRTDAPIDLSQSNFTPTYTEDVGALADKYPNSVKFPGATDVLINTALGSAKDFLTSPYTEPVRDFLVPPTLKPYYSTAKFLTSPAGQKTMEYADRPGQAVKGAIQNVTEPLYTGTENKEGALNSALRGLKEGIKGDAKTSALKAVLPDTTATKVENVPVLGGALNFIGDALLDPVTYIPIAPFTKTGAKVISGAKKAIAGDSFKAITKAVEKNVAEDAAKKLKSFKAPVETVTEETARILGIPKETPNDIKSVNAAIAKRRAPEASAGVSKYGDVPLDKKGFDSYYGIDKAPMNTNYMRMVDDIGKTITSRTGKSTVDEAVEFYKQKYDLPDIKIQQRTGASKKGGSKPIKDANGNITGVNIWIDKNASESTKLGILRHEIEHAVGFKKGFEGTQNKAKYAKTMEESMLKAREGHHQGYNWFEPEYLRKAMVKDLIAKGKTVSEDVLKDFPDLKNKVKSNSESVLNGVNPYANKKIGLTKDESNIAFKVSDEPVETVPIKPKTVEPVPNQNPGYISGHTPAPVEPIPIKSNQNPGYPSGYMPKTVESATNQMPSVAKLQGQGAEKVHGFVENVTSDANMAKEVKNSFEEVSKTYKVLGNKTTLKSAEERFAKGYEAAVEELKTKMHYTPDDVPLARMLANEAAKRGDKETARKLIGITAEKLTEAGQLSQAAKILRKANPVAFVEYFTRRVNKINADGRAMFGKDWKDVKISNKTQDDILNLEVFDEKSFNTSKNKIYDEINEQLPVTKMEKFDTWRRTAMLLNPKTHIRNLAGNVKMAGMRKASDTLATIFEKKLPQEVRTKSVLWKNDKERVKSVDDTWEGIKEYFYSNSRYDIESGIKKLSLDSADRPMFKQGKVSKALAQITPDTKGMVTKAIEKVTKQSFDKNILKTIMDTGMLESLNKFSKYTLQAGDLPFLKSAFKDALGGFMKARGIKEPTQEAIDYAIRRANEATYRQSNSLAIAINHAKRLPVVGKAVDAVIPFAKTQTNIMQSAIDYSPVGLIKSFTYDALKKKSSTQVIENLAKGLTGTGIFALGMSLAGLGLARSEYNPNAKGLEALSQAEGIQPNSIITPLGSYTFDWAQPLAVPLAMGVAFIDSLDKKNKNPGDYVEAVANMPKAAVNSFFQMSMLKSLADLFGGKGSFGDKLLDIPVNYIEQALFPTFEGQIARSTDDTKRVTYAPDTLGTIKNKALAKVPGLSKTLEPKLDVFGNELKQEKPISQFISPGYFMENKESPVSKEVLRLHDISKETTMLPRVAPKNLEYNSEKIILTAKELTQFQKEMGVKNYKNIEKAMTLGSYKNAKDSEKQKIIERIVSTSYDEAKDTLLKNRGVLLSKSDKKSKNKENQKTNKRVEKIMRNLN